MTKDVRWLPDFVANQRVLLAWPFRHDVWRGQAKPARNALLTLLEQLPEGTPVSIVIPPHLSDSLPSSLKHIPRIEIDYDDIWLRDIAPFWLETKAGYQALSFAFNGWDGVQQVIAADQRFSQNLCSYLQAPMEKSRLVTEGGAFTHNGEGDWLIGLASIKQQNPKLTDKQLTLLLGQLFPEQRLHLFDGSLTADETGGHIDNLALFVDSHTLLYVNTQDEMHPDYKTCQRLSELVAQLPEPIKAVPLPLPLPQLAAPEEREDIELTELSLQRTVELPLMCSYVNVLQTDKVVVVPQFGLSTDVEAVQIIQKALPERQVVAVNAREFVLGGGGLHCISHNLPLD